MLTALHFNVRTDALDIFFIHVRHLIRPSGEDLFPSLPSLVPLELPYCDFGFTACSSCTHKIFSTFLFSEVSFSVGHWKAFIDSLMQMNVSNLPQIEKCLPLHHLHLHPCPMIQQTWLLKNKLVVIIVHLPLCLLRLPLICILMSSKWSVILGLSGRRSIVRLLWIILWR